MDPQSFYSLTRSLATAKTRRGFLGSLAALGAGLLGARAADAQVTQAQCGNVLCASNPRVCKPGCVCCVYPNGASRCRPPQDCTAPGTVASTNTSPAPTTTSVPTTTPAPTTTTTTTAAPCVEGAICGDCKVCSAGACVNHLPVCNQGDCGIKTVAGCSVGTTCSTCPECFTCSNGTCQPAVAGTACATGVCDGGACVPKLAQGQACTEDGQCASGFCTDGVCCLERCDGACRRCNLSGLGQQPGTCAGTGGDFAGGPDTCGAAGDQTCCQGQCCAAEQRCGNFGCCSGIGCGGCAAQDDCGSICVSPAPVPCGACQVCGPAGSCVPGPAQERCGDFDENVCCNGQCCGLGEICDGTACRCNDDIVCADLSTGCTKGVCQAGTCATVTLVNGEPCIGQDGACNGGGVCVVECQGTDGTTCSDNKCVTYTCDSGRCIVSDSIVCPIPPLDPDCYGPSLCNAETGTCNRTYLGDNTVCGPRTLIDRSVCCGGACAPSDELNCGTCGNACEAGLVCVDNNCTCSADLLTDNQNCGTCGNACVDSVCFQGNCVDGCVIDGLFFVNGQANYPNVCQVCRTAFSRTSWQSIHSVVWDIQFCNSGGCRLTQCYNGRCGCGTDPTCATLVPDNPLGGCASTPCADAVCVDNTCQYTPKNEGNGCDTAFDPRSGIDQNTSNSTPCKSQFGTCQSGICVAGPINEGGFCLTPPDFDDPEICRGGVGSCFSGECISNGVFCGWTLPEYCNQTLTPVCEHDPRCDPTDPDCDLIASCVVTGEPPASGTITCGTIVSFETEKCCGGQVCVCPPTAGAFCFALECWKPEDLPPPIIL